MPNFDFPVDGYSIRRGSTVDKALLVKFIQRTYQELFSNQDFSHLARTVEQYFSTDTPLWWVYETQGTGNREQGTENREQGTGNKVINIILPPASCLLPPLRGCSCVILKN